MVIEKADIIKDVRIALDENAERLSLTIDSESLELEEIIESKIADAVNAIHLISPISRMKLRISAGATLAVEWIDTDKGIGQIAVPDDLLRLVMFKMSDWEYGVTNLISPETDTYKMMFSGVKGVRGNCQRPMISLSTDLTGRTGDAVIVFSSCDSTDATPQLTYIPLCKTADAYDIEETLYGAVVLKAASFTALSCLNGELSKALELMIKEIIS